MSNIATIIQPKAKDLGDDFIVRRSLPHIEQRMVGPFVFWDHMGPVELGPENEMKVRAHPHIGLATITWLFSGEIMHRDSLGNEQPIRPGEVNWMTAGNGITHSERSKPDQKEILEGIQLWLALPKEHEEVDASFYHCKQEDVPFITTEEGIQMYLIAGEGLGEKSPVPTYSNLFYFNGQARPHQKLDYSLSEKHDGAIYIVEGEITVEGQTFSKYNLITFKKGTSIQFEAKSEVRFMIFGGETFPEKRHMWWNFVSTSQEKIESAKTRWKNDEFPKVINEHESIPLPEN